MYIQSQEVELFGKEIRGCGLVGEGPSLGVGFEVLKAHGIPSWFLLPSGYGSDINYHLPLQCHDSLPDTMLPATMVMDPLKL